MDLFRIYNSVLIVGRYIQVNFSRRGSALAPPIDPPPMATILDERKKMKMSALPGNSVDSKLSPGNGDILNLKL